MQATTNHLTRTAVIAAAYQAQCNLADCTLGYSVRLEMCEILGCDPWNLNEALTDDVIEDILCG